MPGTCGTCAGLVGGNLAGNEADDIESQRTPGEVRKMDVTEMDGIKSAAEEAGFAGLGHEAMVAVNEEGRKSK